MILREAKIDGFGYDWTSFERGLTYCDTAKRMAQWWLQTSDEISLPKKLHIRVRDVGSTLEFMHEVIVRNHIEVVPKRNDEEPHGVLSCIICRQPLNAEWEYAACKKCADELDYDFEEDDRNFDAKNGR